jgi:hypothetical protein
MTDNTLHAIDAAIQAHIASHFEGALVDSWVIVTHAQTLDAGNVSNYRLVTPTVQPFHVDAGLLRMGERIMSDSWDEDETDE